MISPMVYNKSMNRLLVHLQRALPRNKVDIFGKDSLIMSSLPYYTLALLALSGFVLKRPNPFPYIAIVYCLFPILDQIFSLDERNPTQKERKQLQRNDGYFRTALYAAIIFDWANFFKFLNSMQTFELCWGNALELVGIVFIASNLAAAQFEVAHEIMHKPGKFYRVLATIHQSKLFYMHFTHHHLYGHHRDVATYEDPSTARKGQTVYQFIPRCIRDSWLGVYREEKQSGKKWWANHAVLSILASLAFIVVIYLSFGLQPLILQMMITTLAIIYLQAINYLEHYGLMRKKLPNGEYQKTTILHSWNSPHRFTNYLLFKLQRHSDHHQNGAKPYQTLVTMQESPFLPHGYTLMVIMSFFPKVFMRVMDPLAEQYSKLTLEDGGKIDPKVFETSMIETRKFLIEVGMSAVLLMLISKMLMV